MAETIRVTQQEARIILVSDAAGIGHYNEKIARKLHTSKWRQQYNPKLRAHWETITAQPDKFERFSAVIDQALDYLSEKRESRTVSLLSLRFGLEDGFLHDYQEVGQQMNRRRIRPVTTIQLVDQSLYEGITVNQVRALERRAFTYLKIFFRGKMDEFLPSKLSEPNTVVPFPTIYPSAS